ncbi:MAG: DNA-3-methyladenine glycosylase 2 [Candidatus Rokuibacteriota bacterium]
MRFRLTPDGPLDVPATLARYRIWGEDPANRVSGDVFRRVLRLGGRLVPYEVHGNGTVDQPRLEILAPGVRAAPVTDAITREVRAIFGLDFDLPGFYRVAKADPALGPLIEPLYGMRPTLAPTALEMLVGSICAQQVNLTFAFALRARLVRRFGTPVVIGGETVWAFPEARELADRRPRELRTMQFSRNKAVAIRGVARALAAGALDPSVLAAASHAEVIARLTALHGLGRWTADWFLARCLGRGDVCPAGDLGVRKAFAHYYGRGRVPGEQTIRRRARAWGPYQNLAIHYLLAGMRRGRPSAGGGT